MTTCARDAGLAFAGTLLADLSQIVHLDIKPANLFVVIDPAMTKPTAVKVIDFGLAITFPNPFKNPFILHRGTPAFQSPEVPNALNWRSESWTSVLWWLLQMFRGEVCNGLLCDAWAFACTLLGMLTGRKWTFSEV